MYVLSIIILSVIFVIFLLLFGNWPLKKKWRSSSNLSLVSICVHHYFINIEVVFSSIIIQGIGDFSQIHFQYESFFFIQPCQQMNAHEHPSECRVKDHCSGWLQGASTFHSCMSSWTSICHDRMWLSVPPIIQGWAPATCWMWWGVK